MSLPKTVWLPHTLRHEIPRIEHGKLTNVKFVVIHIEQGTEAGTLDWWNTGGHEADGAQLTITSKGIAIQTAPLNVKCWHAGSANDVAPGIEHEGVSGGFHPHVQLHASANRCAWIHHECNLGRPVVGKTIFPHSHGGAAWGGHPLCPGKWNWDLYQSLCHAAYMEHWGR